MDAQTKAFQALKPICVALGESAKSLSEGKGQLTTVANQLGRLKQTLSSHTAKPGALHAKLAEYVFFPISQVLRVSQRASIQCLELCLQCISILIDQGWRTQLPAQTAAQLVILCTLLADKKPQGLPFAETTEDLQASAFCCLYHIFTVAGENAETKRLLTTEAHFPQLGKTISVTLDAVEDAARSVSQAAASACLEALLTQVADREVHASFLPGIVSKLTKTLTPSTKGRTSAKVLVRCLDIVKGLLKSTLGVHEPLHKPLSNTSTNGPSAAVSVIDDSWQTNAATQLKPALANIMRLRSHANIEVRMTLGRLCLTILQACRKTLANSSKMTLETLATILANDRNSSLGIEVEMLLRADASVAGLLQDVLYEWLQSLPTVMQGADEQSKVEKMDHIRSSYELLVQAGIDASSIDRLAATSLRDSVVITLALPGKQQQGTSFSAPLQSLDLISLGDRATSTEFESPLIRHKGQQAVLGSIERFATAMVDLGLSAELRLGVARSLRSSQGDAQVASFWLLLTALERAFQRQSESDAFFDLADEASDSWKEELEELYSFALTVLTQDTDGAEDMRLQALALRALALRAHSAGRDFRFELLDALYPVLHTLATPVEMLQRASITTLNILTSACNYATVKELIVDNVDYLTNAVSLKLNAFDVSPQAPQVLLMMLRLAGPTLLPYLEDTVDSIFAALEDYHGYPLLVELLFRVLGVMAEEGVKTPQLAIEAQRQSAEEDVAMSSWQPTTIQGLATQLRLRAEEERAAAMSDASDKESHPKEPWTSKRDPTVPDSADDVEADDDDQPPDPVDPPPPAPRTYGLLLKITELTQHFLPSASPSLRTSLLGLIRSSVPALAKHENSFLPLINTLWPEVVARLDDDEAHIVGTALDIIRVLCKSARDFMRSRIVQLWPRLIEMHQGVVREIVQSELPPRQAERSRRTAGAGLIVSNEHFTKALARMEQSPSSVSDTSARLIWPSLLALFTAIVEYVQLPPEYFDEALEVVSPALVQAKVRSAFEESNSDAVWLALLRRGMLDPPVMPAVPRGRDWKFAAAAG